MYQIFPDRFARSTQADGHPHARLGHRLLLGYPGGGNGRGSLHTVLRGGDLPRDHGNLDHLKELGGWMSST